MQENYFIKYMKYRAKYLELKKNFNQKGGAIFQANDNFLSNYTKIPNSGQQNCGIYLSNDNRKIIKCGGSYSSKLQEMLENINKNYPNYKIFPKIYNVYEYDNNNYIEMEKFEGDLTQYLYEVLPQNILLQMDNLTYDEKQFYYILFNDSIPKTMNGKSFNIYDYDKMINYLYHHQDEIDQVTIIKKSGQEYYNNIKINKYTDYKNIIDNINKINELLLNPYFANYNIFIKKYEKFLEIYQEQFNNIMPTIEQQIYRLKLLLINIGLDYIDDKLDNYAFNYSDNNEHLGIVWSNNKLINGKYLNISILDWDSGLTKSYGEIRSNFKNFSKYGQYNIILLKEDNLSSYDETNNIFNLDARLINFLKKEYKLALRTYTGMESLKDFNEVTELGNKVILSLDLSEVYLKYLLNEYSIDNLKSRYGYNLFYIDRRPIINYDSSKKYLIKCDTINQNRYKNPEYQKTLLYLLFKNDKVYLVNYNKTTKNYDEIELEQKAFSNFEIFDFIKEYCTI
jgi:hypothetical protein